MARRELVAARGTWGLAPVGVLTDSTPACCSSSRSCSIWVFWSDPASDLEVLLATCCAAYGSLAGSVFVDARDALALVPVGS